MLTKLSDAYSYSMFEPPYKNEHTAKGKANIQNPTFFNFPSATLCSSHASSILISFVLCALNRAPLRQLKSLPLPPGVPPLLAVAFLGLLMTSPSHLANTMLPFAVPETTKTQLSITKWRPKLPQYNHIVTKMFSEWGGPSSKL